MMDRNELARAIITLEARHDELEKIVNINRITAQDVRERQAVILSRLEELKAVQDKQNNMGALDKLFDTLLTKAKNPWYILAAALALFLVLFLFFPDGVIRLAEVFRGE